MSDPREINKAIANHGYWKGRLSDAIETGTSDWSPDNVSKDDLCDFGKWFNALPDVEQKSAYGEKIRPLHAQFHVAAAHVLRLAVEGRKDEARAAMTDLRGDFLGYSTKLTQLLHEWKEAVTKGEGQHHP
jgi:hypothetical protein